MGGDSDRGSWRRDNNDSRTNKVFTEQQRLDKETLDVLAGRRIRERRQAAAGLENRLAINDAVVLAQLRGALQQARVEIEHVAGESFATGRTTEYQGKLAIRGGLL